MVLHSLMHAPLNETLQLPLKNSRNSSIDCLQPQNKQTNIKKVRNMKKKLSGRLNYTVISNRHRVCITVSKNHCSCHKDNQTQKYTTYLCALN